MGFTPSLLKKTDDRTLFFLVHVASGADIFTLLLRRRVAFLALYCHLSATLHTMSIIIVNLQDKRAVFLIFIELLMFSFESPSYYCFSGLVKSCVV
jgi:hypothetical protein